MRHIYFKRGQTIIEAIVVIGVVVILVTGLIAGTTTSLRSSSTGRTRSQALKYAEEGLEFVRKIRDQQWDTFFSLRNASYCLDSTLTQLVLVPLGTCTANITTTSGSFARSVNFSWDVINSRMTVLVSVRYPDGSQTKDVSLTTYYTQWK